MKRRSTVLLGPEGARRLDAAMTAGMFCIALATSLPREYLKGADIVVDNIGRISALVDGLCD